jgi:restriction system protein
MARSGSLSEWERHLAAQRQEDERLARERRRQEKDQEKARQQEHLESQQRAADEKTAAVQKQITMLDEVLTSVLPLTPLSFDRLMASPRARHFDPGPLGLAPPVPDWSDFAPIQPRGLSRFLGGAARYERQMAEARSRFQAAQSERRQRESERQQALAVAKAQYHQKVTEERAKAAARNAYIARRQSAFAAGDAESVEWFAGCVLRASRYPDGFPREFQVAYRPENRDVLLEFELPPRHVVPSVRAYRYVKARDVIEPVPRPEDEIAERYTRLISCVALRTLHEIFSATSPDVVAAVAFSGRVSIIDRATGKRVRRHLLSVSAERPSFEDLVLAAVDPAACLTGLGALVSPSPAGLEAAEPGHGR